MGVRVSAPISDRFTLNYWVVNGTNQVEATNGFKDELFGFTAKPAKNIVWTMNYYLGQEHPDRAVVPPSSPIPVQPGLSFVAITHFLPTCGCHESSLDPRLLASAGRLKR
jgi:hypothetical protein